MTDRRYDRPRNMLALTALIVFLGLILVACGGSAGSVSSSDSASSSDSFSEDEAGEAEEEAYDSVSGANSDYASETEDLPASGDSREYEEAGTEEYSESDEYVTTGAREYPEGESAQYSNEKAAQYDEEYSAPSTTPDADADQYELPEVAAASPTYEPPTMTGPEGKPLEGFLFEVGDELDAKWSQAFAQAGLAWTPPFLQIYQVEGLSIGGCGGAIHNYQGPLYCSETQTIYYPVPWEVRETGRSLEDFGDFAVAAVMAHEMAHHVQGQLGLVSNWNVYSIQMELQADCFAGVWASSVYYEGRLEPGDIEEAVYLLNNIADLPGTPWDDPTAHGTEQQRIDAFAHGYNTGDLGQC